MNKKKDREEERRQRQKKKLHRGKEGGGWRIVGVRWVISSFGRSQTEGEMSFTKATLSKDKLE